MKDISCFLVGLIALAGPTILVHLWHKKTGARYFPALAAFLVCFPVFIVAGFIRTGFSRSDMLSFYLQQGILYGIFEEGAKFLVLRYLLTSYDSRRDAVTYGIGHSAFETFGNGMTCLGLIGTGRAAPDLLPVNLWAYAEGTLFCIALTVLIFYGICTEKSRIMLPTAMFIHFIFNAGSAIIGKSILSISLRSLLTAGLCFAAYRCWNAMFTQYDE